REDLGRGRMAADAGKVPGRGVTGTVLEERLPYFLLAPRRSDEVEIVGDVHAAYEAPLSRRLVVKRQEAGRHARVVRDAQEMKRPPAQEGRGPGRLPLPRQEDRGQPGLAEEAVPVRLIQALEARQRFNLHRRSRFLTGWPRPPHPRHRPRPRPWRRRGPVPDPRPSPRPYA